MNWYEFAAKIGALIVLAIIAHIAVRRGVRRLVVVAQQRSQERALAEQGGGRVPADASPADVPPRRGHKRAQPAPGSLAAGRGVQRAATLCQGIGVLVDVVMVVVIVLTILNEFDVKMAPLLATAGIGGVALGFGAQSLVKDVLSGISIVMEDQFGVGDMVTIGTLTGTVQTIGLRVTRLQDLTGQIWYVRNGEIVTLGNRTQGWSLGKVELPLPLHADPIAVLTQLTKASMDLDADPEWRGKLMEPPNVLGLTSFDAVAATYTVQLKCPATKQGDVERELRARALHALQEAGIPVGVRPTVLPSVHPATGVMGPTSPVSL